VTSVFRHLDSTIQEEHATPSRGRGPEIDGVFWVSPEERFDPLHAGAVLGRSDDCAIRISGSAVSRRHSRIERDGRLWLLRDLDSRNGTFVNGEKRALSPLSPQDTLRVGDWVGVVCRVLNGAKDSGALFKQLTPELLLSLPTLEQLPALESLAGSDISVIIEGETGTGKEVVARAIHQLSGRQGALVAVNCAAIPEALAEAELFGHRKGAFTGAVEAATGHIASAAKGSLFLDEVVDLPLAMQSKLLRVLETRAVTPVGTSQSIEVDFRLITASQEPLETLVTTGEFRADLYARLNGAELKLPPLRARRQEVFRLLCHAMTRLPGPAPRFDSRVIERLCIYAWPYNVRELCQLGRLLRASGQVSFTLEDLPQRFLDPSPSDETQTAGHVAGEPLSSRRDAWLARHAAELDRLKRALHACAGNVSEAARQAGIPRHRARRLLAADPGASG
jgi:DNA-binding NtrC family response regulator